MLLLPRHLRQGSGFAHGGLANVGVGGWGVGSRAVDRVRGTELLVGPSWCVFSLRMNVLR